jgi:4-amino-4-deoxy-L-arabinose transferase-like glycosyltransferase
MSNHLDFGYVDITPIAVYIMALSRLLFGSSIYAMHVFPALTGSFVILFGGLIAKKMGGGRFAQVLTAIAIMTASMYISFAGFFSYDIFDQFMSAVVIYLLIKILKNEGTYKTWILLGFMAGIGIMVKITMGVFLVSLIFGLLMTRARKHLANKWLWVAGAIALICFVPYAIWQAQRGFPFLKYLGNYTQYRSTHATVWELFVYEILEMNPVSILLWLGGLVLLFTKKGRTFRPFAWAFIFYFAVAVIFAIKYYALAGVFLPLLAYGAVWYERGYKRIRQPEEEDQRPDDNRFWQIPRIIYVAAMIVTALFVFPSNTPVLPVKAYIAYNNITGFGTSVKSEDTKLAALL